MWSRLLTLANALACVVALCVYASVGHAATVDLLLPAVDRASVAEALRSDAAALATCLTAFTLLPVLATALGTVALRFEERGRVIVGVVTAVCEGLLVTAAATAWHLHAPALVLAAAAGAFVVVAPLFACVRVGAAAESAAPCHPLLRVCWLLATLTLVAATLVLVVQFSVAPLLAVAEVFVLPDVFAVLDPDMAGNAAVACATLLFVAASFLPVLVHVWPACVRAGSEQGDALALAVVFEGGSLVAFCVQHEALRQQLVLRDACAGLIAAHAATLAVASSKWWWWWCWRRRRQQQQQQAPEQQQQQQQQR